MTDVRLVCHDFAAKAAPHLFKDITVTFKASSFTKPGRMAALERIGHRVKCLQFRMPHSEETFLPPLLDPVTGEQVSFVYTPEPNRPKTPDGKAKLPRYGSWEVTELLIQQYPPLFHAATNIASFERALSALPFLSHLIVSCPSQDLAQRYRRSSVDYALMSLRIALERAPLFALDSLSLLSIHPGALHYLQPSLGPGSTPKSNRRWAQIKNLSIEMPSLPFTVPGRSEHLCILQSYLRFYSATIYRLSFRWLGSTKGPSPLSIEPDTLDLPYARPLSPRLPPSPTSTRQPRALTFPKLKYLLLENAVSDSITMNNFIRRHQRSLREFVFEDITLRNGDWDDVLSSLRARENASQRRVDVEISMDVPCILSPIDAPPRLLEEEEPRIMETLEPQDQFQPTTISRGFAKWLERRRSKREKRQREAMEWTGGEHLKKMLKGGVFGWR